MKTRKDYRTRRGWKRALRHQRKVQRETIRLMRSMGKSARMYWEDECAKIFGIAAQSAKPLTYDDLRAAIRKVNEIEAETHLNSLLSDSWPAERILIRGGNLIQINGQWYAVDKPQTNPWAFTP